VSPQDHPSEAGRQLDISEPVSDEAVQKVLTVAPRGAFALGTLLLGLMLAGWLAFYFLLFLPRGIIR
jgi:hypothetical protein